MMTIKGLDIRAKDKDDKEVEIFKIVFINDYAYGVRNYETTDREYLELYINPSNQ